MLRAVLLVAAAVTFLTNSGCVTIGRQVEGAELPSDRLTEVKIGKTTRAEVLNRFGAPTVVARRELDSLVSNLSTRFTGKDLTVKLDPALLNDVYTYEFRRVHRTAVFLVFFNYYKSVDKQDRIMFFFDAEGRVLGWGLTEGVKEL